MTIPQRVQELAVASAAQVAVRHDGRSVSFGDLARSVDRLAASMLKAGVDPGTRVGISVRDQYHHLVTALALMRIGCPQLTLASHEPVVVRAELARQCGVATMIADGQSGLPEPRESWMPEYDRIFADPETDRIDLPFPSPDTVAVLATSSGTTGRAKIMPMTHHRLVAQALTSCWPSPPHVLYCPTSVEFYAALRHRLYTVYLGGTNVFFDAGRLSLVDGCAQHGVTMISMSSGQARSMIDAIDGRSTARRLPNTRVRVFGSLVGTSLTRSLCGTLSDHIEVVYGATECGLISIRRPPDAEAANSVGRPPPNVAVEIVESDGRVAKVEDSGAIRVRTAGMISAYLGDDALSAQTFRDGWFYPGDIGHLTANGSIVLEGRSDHVMNLSGVKISPAELEAVADAYPGVIECAAIPFRSTVHGDIPVLVVAANEQIDLVALQRYCRERLGVRAPRKLFRVDRLPRTSAGKVARLQLRALVETDG